MRPPRRSASIPLARDTCCNWAGKTRSAIKAVRDFFLHFLDTLHFPFTFFQLYFLCSGAFGLKIRGICSNARHSARIRDRLLCWILDSPTFPFFILFLNFNRLPILSVRLVQRLPTDDASTILTSRPPHTLSLFPMYFLSCFLS